MVKRLVRCGRGKNLFHDLYDDEKRHRIEVKFSKVQRAAETVITEDTVMRCIEEATSAKRMVMFSECREVSFDCNIQQIKRAEFEFLYYGLFFSDCIKIFRIASKDIGSQIYYSDRQHKGNVGEGQFHINQDSIAIHLQRYLIASLTYAELHALLC